MAETPSKARRFGQVMVDRLPQLGVAIVAGVLLCLSFPPFGWWYLGFVAFALLAWVLTRETTTVRGGFGYGFLFGAAFYLPLLPWVGAFVGPFPWIGLSLAEAVFPALFGAAAVVVRRLPGWPLWFAGLWAAQEWLKSTVPFGGFPWGVVAYGQTESPLRSIAQLGGAPLLSFAVVLVGFSLAAMVFEVIQWWRRDDAQKAAPPAVVVPGLCISAVLLVTALTWPHVRQSGLGAGDEHSVTVAVVQGNVPRLGLDFNAQRRAVLDNHVRETLRLAEDVRAGRAPRPMFVVWPENSSDIDPLANPDAHELISSAAEAIDAPILVGAVVEAPGATPEEPTTTNSVIVWNPGSGPGERHDKQIVQPFGEYLPWRGFFRNFSEYADRAGYFVPGDGTGVVHPAGVPVGVATCWEVIFDRAPRESVRNGAQMLVVPSNNATFTESMSEQQLAFARLRAVEHDRYVVVAGTTGISAIISPDGRELARTAFYEPAYLDAAVRLKTQLSAATRFGPLVEGLLIALGVGSLLTAILHNKSFVRRRVGGGTTDRGAT
ncbi:apolipoprotein N-acyltransferase [Mycolicibacterium novocastrense]|uniref:apolipoprotein N-acyltransferase n=1 Tax=Mycolicibacterium novocastrense TaxID=59813 RepID=UPI000749D9F9|nr:apolipoprotein N-acyltransferase [Mycolicibacterium novocastrense]KUH71982.1 apolipoprotein N-acyltransferase [Mycolicibacterium novocastrense]KUH72155.1 apolipoprotein N-acyltransferase [Mycolicibacterium novocastrense]KUH73106.1 apolipoprotein N-acyltransferase [Mycolicibacterium novocastrense]